MQNAELIIAFLIKTFVNTSFESDANAIASLSFMYLDLGFIVWSWMSTVTDWTEYHVKYTV